MRTAIISFLVLVVPPVFGQSVADAARANRPKDAKITTQRVFTDDDVQHSSQPIPAPDPLRSATENANRAIQDAQGLTAREMADNIVHNIQFPGRPDWETKLYDQEQKVIAAGQKVLDVAKSHHSDDALRNAKAEFDVEVWKRDSMRNDGIARAAKWERK
jgi:hypothetical protein